MNCYECVRYRVGCPDLIEEEDFFCPFEDKGDKCDHCSNRARCLECGYACCDCNYGYCTLKEFEAYRDHECDR